MTNIKDNLLTIASIPIFIVLHVITYSSSLWISKFYVKYFGINIYTENTVAAISYSIFVFTVYASMIIANKNFLINQKFIIILASYVVTAMFILIGFIFIVRTNLKTVFSALVIEIILLIIIDKFRWYKIKILMIKFKKKNNPHSPKST